MVFVLNKSWVPVCTIHYRRAFKLLVAEKSEAILIPPEGQFDLLNWVEWFDLEPIGKCILGANGQSYRIPDAIRLTEYNGHPRVKTFSKRALFLRDQYRCQYCNRAVGAKLITIDHILPRCRGGETSFKNCVTSCKDCNSQKGDRLPEECKRPENGTMARRWRGPDQMQLLRKPTIPPTVQQLWEDFMSSIPKSSIEF